MSADDLIRRRIEAEQWANQHLPQDFQHTIGNVTPSPQEMSGRSIHDGLLDRAKAREELLGSMGDTKHQFTDYSKSHVGAVGSGAGVLKATAQSRKEYRKRLNERYNKDSKNGKPGDVRRKVHERNRSRGERRQAFSVNGEGGLSEQSNRGPSSRQEFNSGAGGGGARFHEPPSRGYNPYA